MGDIMDATGNKFYTLAFITAKQTSEGWQPSWGGFHLLTTQFYYDQIRKVRLRGGDVIVSFGGANGRELAEVITNVQVRSGGCARRYSG